MAQSALLKRQDLYKCKTPPWKDAYRQRCKDKLKQNRAKVFAMRRSIPSQEEDLEEQPMEIKDIMALEWAKMRTEMKGSSLSYGADELPDNHSSYVQDMESLFETIQTELKMEEQELLRQYEEHVLHEEEELCSSLQALSTHQVICPLCEKDSLLEHKGAIICKCGFRVNTEQDCISLKMVQKNLEYGTKEHSDGCESKPVFEMAEKFGISTLIMSCQDCDFMFIVI